MGNNIERLTTDIFYVNDNLLVQHETVFGHKDRDGRRRPHISKNNYTSNKYTDVNQMTSYRLNTSDYIILKPYPKDKEKKVDRVLISQQHLHSLKRALASVCKWFDEEYDKIFITKNGKLTVSSYGVDLSSTARPLVQSAALEFRPAIVKGTAGVVMFLSNYTDKVFMTCDELMSLEDFASTFSFALNSKISTMIVDGK